MSTPFFDSPRLPVVDISVSAESATLRTHVAAQLDWALAEFGFFYVAGHGIDERAVAHLFELSRGFFAQDEARKASIRMALAGAAWRGWFPVGAELTSGQADVKEGIYFGVDHAPDDPRVLAPVPMHGQNLYPPLTGFDTAVQSHLLAFTALGHRLMALVALALGENESDLRERLTADPTILFRIFHYPALANPTRDHAHGASAPTPTMGCSRSSRRTMSVACRSSTTGSG